MAPFAFLALFLAAADPDLPIGRSTPPALLAPAAAPAPARAPASSSVPNASVPALTTAGASDEPAAPSDDYGFVAFCYGAESGYLKLYDQVMPEVERIERAFPGPTPIDQALAEYPQLRSESQAHLAAYAAALTAAEQASPQAIGPRGLQVIRQGRATWDGAATATPAETARAWMGWAAPDDCSQRAAALTERSRLQSAALARPAIQGQSAVELDRLANPTAVAGATTRAPSLPATPAAAPPQPLALRGPADAPSVVASSTPASQATGLGVSFTASPATPAGLNVSFDGSAATPAAPSAPQAVPSGLPLLVAPPSASPTPPEPPTWRGIL